MTYKFWIRCCVLKVPIMSKKKKLRSSNSTFHLMNFCEKNFWFRWNAIFLQIFTKFKILFSCGRPLLLITWITCSKWPSDWCLWRRFRKTDVVFWIINVVTKSGNAPFRYFQLNLDNWSGAKFLVVFKSDKSRLKSCVPEPMSRLTSIRGRLVQMVDQNGSKFECL